ncbi:hypothetical protein G195_011495, partial [Phytophthora kernoviae 00238/432]
MQFSTAKILERAATNPLCRRQSFGLLKRQRFESLLLAPTSTHHFASDAAATLKPGQDQGKTTSAIHKTTYPEPTNATNEPAYIMHFKQSASRHATSENGEPIWDNPINHAVYDLDKITTMEQTHHPIVKFHERVAFIAVKALRTGFDILSGYRGPGGAMTEKDWLNRCLFLESVAGVPGMVGGMLRHLRSLRLLKRD